VRLKRDELRDSFGRTVFPAILVVVTIGLIVSYFCKSTCENEVLAEATKSHVVGISSEGKLMQDPKIWPYSTVMFPFVVKAGYGVPRGRHPMYHEVLYFVLPWKVYKLRSTEFVDRRALLG